MLFPSHDNPNDSSAEYDRIEGTSEHTDGGVAPAQSVVGILDAGHTSAGSSSVRGSSSEGFVSSGSSSHPTNLSLAICRLINGQSVSLIIKI